MMSKLPYLALLGLVNADGEDHSVGSLKAVTMTTRHHIGLQAPIINGATKQSTPFTVLGVRGYPRRASEMREIMANVEVVAAPAPSRPPR